ncbi:hypothetical protein P154DRAFT_579790 [Amniculicola lignicola CBS 123094]|uniref:Uncharacterized protein n=1 Tax=Amniculicola lignicola CBS 123094 TaxID=1392246 RepID=A0A6A5W5G8_9PLEO|nr:hypothetical protein P154DRAFT_579790 [Amniculicola lignicola CBS 123094]
MIAVPPSFDYGRRVNPCSTPAIQSLYDATTACPLQTTSAGVVRLAQHCHRLRTEIASERRMDHNPTGLASGLPWLPCRPRLLSFLSAQSSVEGHSKFNLGLQAFGTFRATLSYSAMLDVPNRQLRRARAIRTPRLSRALTFTSFQKNAFNRRRQRPSWAFKADCAVDVTMDDSGASW